MLSKLESRVMNVIYNSCKDKEGILISASDIVRLINLEDVKIIDVQRVVDDLYTDGYFDLVYSERKGEQIFCISLTEKGKGYKRSNKIFKRNLLFRVTLTIVLAIFSFLIGLILKAIF